MQVSVWCATGQEWVPMYALRPARSPLLRVAHTLAGRAGQSPWLPRPSRGYMRVLRPVARTPLKRTPVGGVALEGWKFNWGDGGGAKHLENEKPATEGER